MLSHTDRPSHHKFPAIDFLLPTAPSLHRAVTALCSGSMSLRARRLLALVSLLGLLSGCARLPQPAPYRGDSTRLASTTSAAAAAASEPSVGRRSAPGTPYTRARPAAQLDSRLLVTTQVAHSDLFFHSPQNGGPRLLAAQRLYRGQRAFILAFAGNYARDAQNRTDLTYRLVIRKPDGTTDGAPFDGIIWQDAVATDGLVLFPASTITFWTEPTDPLGDYRFELRVQDHLSGDTIDLAHTAKLIDYAPPVLAAEFDPNLWFNTYYQNPTPELALPALGRLFDQLPSDKRQGALPPILGFYDQVLTDNTWLLPAFSARLAEAAPDEAYALSIVLGFHLRNATSAPSGMPETTWTRLAPFRSSPWPFDPDNTLTLASQFDALWGRFYASGLYAPIGRLLEPLAFTADLGAAQRWTAAHPAQAAELNRDNATTDTPPPFDLEDPDTPDDIRREILLRTALWSLRANAAQHPLVRGCLDWTLRYGELPADTQTLLSRALAPAPAPATP